jgi:hypothetical protein
MKTEGTQGWSRQPKPGGLFLVVLMCTMTFVLVGGDVANCMQNHYYPKQALICHLIILLLCSIEINRYLNRISDWKRKQKEWRDQFNGKKDPE